MEEEPYNAAIRRLAYKRMLSNPAAFVERMFESISNLDEDGQEAVRTLGFTLELFNQPEVTLTHDQLVSLLQCAVGLGAVHSIAGFFPVK